MGRAAATIIVSSLLASICTSCRGDGSKPDPDVPGPHATLRVANPFARSCDVLLIEETGAVSSIVFSDEVTGQYAKRSPKLALSFVARSASGFTSSVATLEMNESLSGTGAGLAVSSAECTDQFGQTISDSGVVLE